MKVKLCPDNNVGIYYPKGNFLCWCGAKLPCGKCIGIEKYMPCGRIPIDGEVPCEQCKAKFICLTHSNNYEHPESCKLQGIILKTLKGERNNETKARNNNNS